jgi:hypothetical protein
MKGSIILNGNISFEPDYIHTFKDKILSSVHSDPEVRKNRKVLLITAAWRGDEHKEEHVKKALKDIGIPSIMKDGYDQNIQNLSIYHEFNNFKKQEPELHRFYHEKQKNIKAIKELYRQKNFTQVQILKRQLCRIKEEFPGTTFAQAMAYDVKEGFKKIMEARDIDTSTHRFHYYCRELQYTLKHIRSIDKEMAVVSSEFDDYFFKKSGIEKNPTYIGQKKMLEERILSSNTIFIFGGHVAVLMNRLNFYKLKDAFRKALASGTNFLTVSAGTDVMCDKIILFGWVDIEYPDPCREFEFFDHGFELITKLTPFPHCIERIKTDDPDTLSYLAHRFDGSICVGLDQKSFLKLETYVDENGEMYERYVSVGKDEGVYVFNKSGEMEVKQYGQELAIPGSKLYEQLHTDLP